MIKINLKNFHKNKQFFHKKPKIFFDNKKVFDKKNIIIGKNSIIEAFNSVAQIECLYISKNHNSEALQNILLKAKNKNIKICVVEKHKLDNLCNSGAHQGIVAVMRKKIYSTIEDILQTAADKNEKPFIIIADSIEDPHNLGAIIRTAECAGAHGIIIPNRRAADVNFTVHKTSAGAAEHVKIAKVTNIADTVKFLKTKGLWIYGTDFCGKCYYNEDLGVPLALIIGSEGNGISQLVKKNCDVILSIPLFGKINSLNASVASGILMFEIRKQRF